MFNAATVIHCIKDPKTFQEAIFSSVSDPSSKDLLFFFFQEEKQMPPPSPSFSTLVQLRVGPPGNTTLVALVARPSFLPFGTGGRDEK